MFREVFFTIAARAIESEDVSSLEIQKSSNQVNQLSRRKSLLSKTVSEEILGAAYYEIFRFFNSIVKFYDMLIKAESVDTFNSCTE